MIHQSVNSDGYACSTCGSYVWVGTDHACGGSGAIRSLNPTSQTAPSYTIQRCPVCQGRGNVPAGFYTPGDGVTSTAPEDCRTCGGRGILKVGALGHVEPA